jgi:hypothetical protein
VVRPNKEDGRISIHILAVLHLEGGGEGHSPTCLGSPRTSKVITRHNQESDCPPPKYFHPPPFKTFLNEALTGFTKRQVLNLIIRKPKSLFSADLIGSRILGHILESERTEHVTVLLPGKDQLIRWAIMIKTNACNHTHKGTQYRELDSYRGSQFSTHGNRFFMCGINHLCLLYLFLLHT